MKHLVVRPFPTVLYHGARKWFTLSLILISPVLFLINAPFGRFSPSQENIFLVDGIKAWIFMEVFSPFFFVYGFLKSPLSYYKPPFPSLYSPQGILSIIFLIHYANRAILLPLRTPSRSKSHLVVPLTGAVHNIINGSLMGSYLSSPIARIYLGPHSLHRPSFYFGLALWGLGFAGNILHDEILLDIRRKAKSKGKGKVQNNSHSNSGSSDGGGTATPKGKKVQPEYYAIPQGWLYNYVSHPNYLCEWIEWFGFALAAAPFPYTETSMWNLFSWKWFSYPSYAWEPNLSPPWIFFIAEVLYMLPRAYRGHQWYRSKFKDSYPKNRKAVIPFLL